MPIGLLKISNTKKYGDLTTSIRDQFDCNIDVYPKTLNSAYELMENHSGNRKRETIVATTMKTKIVTETAVGKDEDTEGEKKTDKITSLACSTIKRAKIYQVLTAGQSHKSPALGVKK